MVHVLLLAVVLDSHDLKSIPRHLEFGIWDEEFISGTSLWRGGRGVDENRFGTVRQENKMCRIKHLLKLFFFFLRILGCLIRFSHNLEVTVHNTAGNLVKSLGVRSSCPTTTTLMYLCTKLSHCF